MLGSEEINIRPICCNQYSTQYIVCVRNGVHPPSSMASWRIFFEFLIPWWRPSCPDPYKNIFHQVQNLTDQRAYSTSVNTFLISFISHVYPLAVEASTFSKKMPPFRLALQIKVLLVENSKSSTFKVLPQNIKLGILWRGRLGQWKNWLHGKINCKRNPDHRECIM